MWATMKIALPNVWLRWIASLLNPDAANHFKLWMPLSEVEFCLLESIVGHSVDKMTLKQSVLIGVQDSS